MRRRRFIALLGAAATAGCADRSESDVPPRRSEEKMLTPPANVTVYTEARPMPTAPNTPSREGAREFVATHEENLVYNQLIGKADRAVEVSGRDYPTSVEVDPAQTQVVLEREAGVYVLSSCSGRAEYYCEYADPNRGCGRSSGRNAHAVTHFVGDGEHVRIPYNWYACKRSEGPYESDDPVENVDLDERERGARLNIYDFSGWKPTVEVTITHQNSGDVALEKSYDMSLALAVQPDVARRKGTYTVEVDVAGATASGEWEITSKNDPSWRGLCIYVSPSGEPAVLTVGTDGPIELHDTGCRVRETSRE